MASYENCPNCFMPVGGALVCPHCGHDRSKEKPYTGILPAFTLLNNRYLLGRVLGKGGFGITYIAKDIICNQICAIKEYMPSEYSTRSGGTMNIVPFSDDKAKFVFSHGREKFMVEAKTLLKLRDDPIVVDILDYFTQNNTAYLVMEYLDGQDLRKRARASGGKLDPDFAKTVFVTVASSLMEIHKRDILHRDLSPENIIVTSNGNIKLIDFGAARNFVMAQNKGMSILLKPGFAPPEQYNAKGVQGPWSDVYALCATFYTLVSGKPLVDALFRYRGEPQPSLQALGCPVSQRTSAVIERGMELDYKKRYPDFKTLLDDIDIAVTTRPATGVRTPAPPQTAAGVRPSTPPQTAAGIRPSAPPQTAAGIRTAAMHPYVAAIVGGGIRNKVMIGSNAVLKIGRSAQGCQYVISGDTNISRVHCTIRFDGHRLFLTDVSVNGTFFEKGGRLKKNQEYEVKPGTRFYLATPNHMMIVNR